MRRYRKICKSALSIWRTGEMQTRANKPYAHERVNYRSQCYRCVRICVCNSLVLYTAANTLSYPARCPPKNVFSHALFSTPRCFLLPLGCRRSPNHSLPSSSCNFTKIDSVRITNLPSIIDTFRYEKKSLILRLIRLFLSPLVLLHCRL